MMNIKEYCVLAILPIKLVFDARCIVYHLKTQPAPHYSHNAGNILEIAKMDTTLRSGNSNGCNRAEIYFLVELGCVFD